MRMKWPLISTLLLVPLIAVADPSLRCERYKLENGEITNRTEFHLDLDRDASVLQYRRIEGDPWFLPQQRNLDAIWIADDSLRVVAYWEASDYGENSERWHPIIIFDVDFARPRYRVTGHGGFADFSESVAAPEWKRRCERTN